MGSSFAFCPSLLGAFSAAARTHCVTNPGAGWIYNNPPRIRVASGKFELESR